jgi:hypothetical protein
MAAQAREKAEGGWLDRADDIVIQSDDGYAGES